MAEKIFMVERSILSTVRARVHLQVAEADAVAADAAAVHPHIGSVIITYDDEARIVTVTPNPTEAAQGSVRSRCGGLPPEKSTRFSENNLGLLASVVNTAAEGIFFAGSSRPLPITVEAVFRGAYEMHNFLVKMIISDSEILTPSLEANVVSKTQLSLYTSEKIDSGVIFCFVKQNQVLEEGFPEKVILLSKKSRDQFEVHSTLGNKLLRVYHRDIRSPILSVSTIPKPLLFILRFHFEENLDARAQMLSALIVKPSCFILSVLEWLPYLWIEPIAICGCKVLGSRVNFDVGRAQGLENVALSLGMEKSFPI